MIKQDYLNVSSGNVKIPGRNILDISAGKTCPAARYCLSTAVRSNGKTKIVDGPETEFRCYAASQEARLPNVYDSRAYNTKLLFDAVDNGTCTDLIDRSIDKRLQLTRIHSSGDFFCKEYLDSWLEVASNNPKNTFYCYTKCLNWFLDIGLPSNFFMTASYGGKYDHLIDQGYFDRVAYVVNTEEDAAAKGLPIDHDDSHCLLDGSFCLLVHNTQPKGSAAAKALADRKKQNKFIGYSKRFQALAN